MRAVVVAAGGSASVIILFVDSNFFLQCKWVEELPWQALFPDQDILLLVPGEVQKELDSFKTDAKGRRQKRARKAASLFRVAIEAPDLRAVIRGGPQSVALSFPPPAAATQAGASEFDRSRADERIVEDVVVYRSAHSNEDVRLLTHDTHMMLTARRHGVPCTPIPEDWLMAAEPDERDKRIESLEREVAALRHQSPVLNLEISHDGSADGERVIEIEVYPPLADTETDELVSAIIARHPRVETFEGHGLPLPQASTFESMAVSSAMLLSGRYVPPSKEDIRQYRDTEYPRWIDDVREALKRLPAELELPSRRFPLLLTLSNEGQKPAMNLVVEVTARGGLLLQRKGGSKGRKQGRRYPSPPVPPRARYTPGPLEARPFSDLSSLSLAAQDSLAHRVYRQPERDLHTFYWKDAAPQGPTERWVLTCGEFRHKEEPWLQELFGFIPSDCDAGRVALEVRVTASNLPVPVSKTLPIALARQLQPTLKAARRALGLAQQP